MLQAAHTRLLNSNNFVVVGDIDKVYNTEPAGLRTLIDSLDIRQSNRTIDYVTIANYCKSLILNPNIASLNLDVEDILKIWECRIICLFVITITSKLGYGKDIVSDKMLKFEASNMLKQVTILNSSKPTMNHNTNTLIRQNTVKLDKLTSLMLMWIKHNGQESQLVEYLYEEVFVARYKRDQEYLQRLKYGIIAVLLNRGELLSVQSLLENEPDVAEIVETDSVSRAVGYCIGKCLEPEEELQDEGLSTATSYHYNARNKLIQALIGALALTPHM